MGHKLHLVNSQVTFRDKRVRQELHGRYLACWYGGVEPNHSSNDVPLINVFFKKIGDDNTLEGRARPVPLTITSMGQVRLGSVWKNGQSTSSIRLESYETNVEFSGDAFKFTSMKHAWDNGLAPPIELNHFLLPYNNEYSWLLDFPISNTHNLLVPCWEFFYRTYGVSSELKRIIATYPWSLAIERVHRPIDEPAQDGIWKVCLGKRLHDGDAIFAAHTKYNPYTKQAVDKVHRDLELGWAEHRHLFPQRTKRPAFTRIGPWFTGQSRLRVEGLWINNGKTFLAIRITGFSYPETPTIEFDRENTNLTDKPADDENAKSGWGTGTQQIEVPPEFVDHNNEFPPGHNTGTVQIPDATIAILGDPPETRKVRRDQAKTKSGGRTHAPPSDDYSTGTRSGSSTETGELSICPEARLESEGALRDIWKAFTYLRNSCDSSVHNVEWFTYGKGFQNQESPQLIPLEPFNRDQYADLVAGARTWPYMAPGSPQLRGALVMRVTTSHCTFFVVEIQRRAKSENTSSTKSDSKPAAKGDNESFQGFAVKTDQKTFVKALLPKFLSDIRHVKGVVKNALTRCSHHHISYSHRHSKKDKITLEGTARRIVREMT